MDGAAMDGAAMDSEALAEAAYRQGRALHERGRPDEARILYEKALQSHPRHFHALHLLGLVEIEQNRPQRAVELIGKALLIEPRHAAAHNDHGSALLALARCQAAIDSYDQAVALKPDYAEAHYNRGNAHFDLGQYTAALADYDAAVTLKPGYIVARINRGLVLFCMRRFRAAIESYDEVIAIEPDNAQAHCYRGDALRELQQYQTAIESYDLAIASNSGYAEAYNGRGSALAKVHDYRRARASIDQAIALRNTFAAAWCNRANVLLAQRRWSEALASFDRAIALQPSFAEAWSNRGNVFKELRQFDVAIASYDRAIEIDANLAEAHSNRATALRDLGLYEAAITSYDRALALNSDLPGVFGMRRHTRMQICDWGGYEADLTELAERIERGEATSPPFPLQALTDSAALLRRAAEIWVREECPPNHCLPPLCRRAPDGKIRIGYFSADFRIHPVSLLTAEMFETHDRARFEVIAFSFGRDTQDYMRRRLERSFDRFVDVSANSNEEIALLARDLKVDIAVDLGGFTEDSRPGVFALRAAPLQLSYVGYLGTMAAPYMDYLIADSTLIPAAARQHYAEKLIYLPSYQANDSKRHIADRIFTREDLGLPPEGFVFCCFNTSYKITPGAFSSWMRILTKAPRSVLFLCADHATAGANLRREARQRQVDPDRLVFGGRLPLPEYLARYRSMDLFLDTLPYNAGATASDALWAGLPVLTCAGEAFSARMGASLLEAVGLPDLIASTAARYEEIAVELATNPALYARVKRRLEDNRPGALLFDTRRFTRSIEAAYAAIHERYQADQPPLDLHVPPTRPIARPDP